MKLLLLSAYLMSFSFPQQDGKSDAHPTSAKPANGTAVQPQREVVQSSPFNAAYKSLPSDSAKHQSRTPVQTSPFSATYQQDPAGAPKK
ncbi:MAG: hypothetical protein JWO03_976 [Bacteroidetes bacterium]|nr:hypothetical protein [Bacteroidota bacterium]